jgi:predicted amidohydrolase
VATCRFPVDARTERNCPYVMRQLRSAKEQGAHIAHFPEACLSGYAGTDFDDYRGFDRELLESSTLRVMELAAEPRLWVVLWRGRAMAGILNSGTPVRDSRSADRTSL